MATPVSTFHCHGPQKGVAPPYRTRYTITQLRNHITSRKTGIVKPFLSASIAVLLFATSAQAVAAPKVVASIAPVHSLVAGVMQGIGEPQLIINGAGSPHTYSLKPSQAAMLEQADVIVWVGHELEAFLEKPLETLAGKAVSVELLDTKGITKLALREGGPFDEHAKDGEKHEDHSHGETDAHAWLDPENARTFVYAITAALSKQDPQNAAAYDANARKMAGELDELTAEVSALLEPAKGKGFIVFHDAYQYFENRFGIFASGSITVSPEVTPGAERISEISAKVKDLGAACVFAEPQFEPKLISVVVEGTSARTGVLDPLGSSIEKGAGHYPGLIRSMAKSLSDCLSQGS